MYRKYSLKTSEMKLSLVGFSSSPRFSLVKDIVTYEEMSTEFRGKYSRNDYNLLLLNKDNYKEVISTFNYLNSSNGHSIVIIDDAGIEEPPVDISAIEKALAMYQ